MLGEERRSRVWFSPKPLTIPPIIQRQILQLSVSIMHCYFSNFTPLCFSWGSHPILGVFRERFLRKGYYIGTYLLVSG